ncbi:hypothetical protein HD806DRAFT_493709 [Xylariaceae sp. AK1471]|nr:hypothetical protein HD806DRAFT_493709 [Xylariaceae sp. AK1471]
MLWAPWTAVSTLLLLCALLVWWFSKPKTTHLNLFVAIGCALYYWAIAPEVAQSTPARLYRLFITIATSLRLDALILYHANMLLTGAAFLWLAHRAVQTLRKSVNDLIGVLGVEVPDAPDVSLAGIRADAATLNWTRPLPTRPVAKFTIQVNGVNVGDSANQETAITVTGLKPNHFYNIRVIAVGYNNFQAGSRVIRLRTFGRDGRPQLGDGRIPSNFVPDEQQVTTPNDIDEDGVSRGPAAGVETASIPDGSTLSPRDANLNTTVGRRNTLTRKHSPSTTSMEQSVKDAICDHSEQSLQELGEKFESIRKEIEEIQAQIAKDEKEHKELIDELAEEKKVKRRIQKEKDDTTEKLKREMGSTERAMRSAQQRKTQKEKLLRDKEAERQKLHDDMAKWEKDIASMRKRQDLFEQERDQCQEDGDGRSEDLRQEIAQAQASLAQEEAELKEKGRELKEAEDQRKKLPGGEESEEWREKDAEIKRNWEIRYKDLQRRWYAANRKLRMVNDYERVLQAQLAAAQQSGLPFMYNQANSSGVDFDLTTQGQLKRRSRNSNSLSNVAIPSPAQSFAVADRSYGTSSNYGPSRPPTIPPGFAQGPFMDTSIPFSTPLDEDGMRALTAGAPLSPTATSLLPAGMLDDLLDDDPPSPGSLLPRHETFGSGIPQEYDPQSPTSPARSPSLLSSPQSSTQHLPFSQYTGENSERRSLRGPRGEFGPSSSPIAPAAQTSNRNRFLPWLHRGPKETAEEAPALGTLKPTQSQSLPRETEDGEPANNKRRISFSAGWNMFNRGTAPPRPDVTEATAPSPRGLASRRLGLATNTSSLGSNIFSERDPNSPRPLSIASSEIPRPSTDSGSIWGRNIPQQSRLWPTEESPWTGSRNPSRRPSLHGSPFQLKTTLADADDEILDESELLHASPSQVGIIGTKPSKSLSQRLNPTAPTFMGGLFRGRSEKDRESDKEIKDPKDKSKGKGREKDTKEKKPRQSFTSVSDIGTLSLDESPSDPRKSRDTFSVDSPSITESRESLSLEQPFSYSPSDQTAGVGFKDQESGLRKLLRKGSSSKFSFSSVRGLGGKKGANSVTSSDRNASGDRTSFDEFAEDGSAQFLGRSYDSLHSSPSVGPTSGPRSAKDKPVGWGARFTMKKKTGKEKESLDIERDDSTSNTVPNTPSLAEK